MIKKIGFSASRCIRDIVENKVSLEDVVFITTGTNCPTLEHWMEVIDAYTQIEVYDERSLADLDKQRVLEVAQDLWQFGKIHQPRVFGAHRSRSAHVWMDLVHTKEDRDANPMLAKAWEQAQMIENLVAPDPVRARSTFFNQIEINEDDTGLSEQEKDELKMINTMLKGI